MFLGYVGMCQGKYYGKPCEEGDIIDMYLDMNKLELSYAINNKNYGVACKVDKCEYKAVVYIRTQNQQIDLIID